MCWGCDCCDLLGLCLTAKFSWYLSPPCFLECLFPTTQTLCMKTFCCSWHFLTVEPHSALNLWRSTMCYNSKLRGNFPHECTKRRWQQEKTLQDIRRNIWWVRTLVRDKTEHTQTHTHPPGRLMFAIMVIFRYLCQCQTPFIGKSEIKLKTQVQLLQLLLNISCSITS